MSLIDLTLWVNCNGTLRLTLAPPCPAAVSVSLTLGAKVASVGSSLVPSLVNFAAVQESITAGVTPAIPSTATMSLALALHVGCAPVWSISISCFVVPARAIKLGSVIFHLLDDTRSRLNYSVLGLGGSHTGCGSFEELRHIFN